jgi:putative hemolysin
MEENARDPVVWQLLLQAALIAVNAVFACAEIALISINPVRLEKLAAGKSRQARAAKRLRALTEKPAKFLATIQVGITLAGFLGSAFAADNFSRKLAAALDGVPLSRETIAAVSLVLITLVLSFFTLVLGELVPKRIAMRYAGQIAFAFSPFIAGISRLFAPVVWLLTASTNGLLRVFGIDPEAEAAAVTEEEIRLLVDAGSARGAIAAGEKDIIHNVFEFNDKTAGELMTHRRDAVILWMKDGDTAWEKTLTETRYRHYPVCGGDADEIRGVLDARDYLALADRSRAAVMARVVVPAQLVSNTIAANALFERMQARRNHFALVIDEYGGMDGIITMNDLLGELVGDLDSGGAQAERAIIEEIAPGFWQVGGAAPLEKVARKTGAPLPTGGYDTFAGYVFTLLGRVPADGERAEVEDAGLKISVTEVMDRRLVSALVRRL